MNTQLDATRTRNILNSRRQINTPGKYSVKVTNTVPFTRPDGTMTTIVGLAAMTPYGVAQATEFLRKGDLANALNTNMSGNVLSTASYIPKKGEIVNIHVETITNKSGLPILVVSSFEPVSVTEAPKVNFDSLFEELANGTDAKGAKADSKEVKQGA